MLLSAHKLYICLLNVFVGGLNVMQLVDIQQSKYRYINSKPLRKLLKFFPIQITSWSLLFKISFTFLP